MIDYGKVEEVIEELKEELKKEIKEKEDEVIAMKNFLKKEFERRVEEKGIDAEVFLGGSAEKGTWLPEKIEFDVFIRIKKEEDFEKFYGICPEGERMMGSRDYFKLNMKGYDVEVVPIKYIESPDEAENVTDLSPFHVDFVKSHTDEEMRLDIRLLKRFLKRRNLYGAETYIGGFSGYMCELLIIHYGSLLRLFKAVEERWRSKVYIDIMRHYRGFREAIFNLGYDKTRGPLILVDPTYKYRNAGAALTKEKYCKFIFEVRKFLRNPTKEEFLKEVRIKTEDLLKASEDRGTRIKIFEVKVKGKRDYFLGKLKRIVERMSERLSNEGWRVYNSGFFEDGERVFMFFEFETIELSKKKKHFGPPVWVKGDHFDRFLEKHKNVYVFAENLVTDVVRDSLKEILSRMISEYGLEVKEVV